MTGYDVIEGSRISTLKVAPTLEVFTEYDEIHLVTYPRLRSADYHGPGHFESADYILDIPDSCDHLMPSGAGKRILREPSGR